MPRRAWGGACSGAWGRWRARKVSSICASLPSAVASLRSRSASCCSREGPWSCGGDWPVPGSPASSSGILPSYLFGSCPQPVGAGDVGATLIRHLLLVLFGPLGVLHGELGATV